MNNPYWLTNREAIEITLKMLESSDQAERFFAVRTLGSLARSKKGDIRERVLLTLQKIVDNKAEREFLRKLATFAIQEINGEADAISEKYDMEQVPVGSASDQYYLKRG